MEPRLPPSLARSPPQLPRTAKRLLPEKREQRIVTKAIEHFTRHGFYGSTPTSRP